MRTCGARCALEQGEVDSPPHGLKMENSKESVEEHQMDEQQTDKSQTEADKQKDKSQAESDKQTENTQKNNQENTQETLHENAKEAIPETTSIAKSTWGLGNLSWSNVLETVKKQSEAVIDVYKRDLTEFVAVVQEETSHLSEKLKPVVASTTETVKSVIFEDSDDEEPTELEKVIEEGVERAATAATKVAHNVQERLAPGMHAVADKMAQYSKSLNVSNARGKLTNLLSNAVSLKPSEEEVKRRQQQVSKKMVYDRKQALVLGLRANSTTFLSDPTISTEHGSPRSSVDVMDVQVAHRFITFARKFNIAEHAGQISRMLNEDDDLKRTMRRLVPSKVDYETFWLRYFFRVSEIDVEEERRRQLVKSTFIWVDSPVRCNKYG